MKSLGQWTVLVQAVHIINAVKGSHNRVEAAVCLYARMVDKDNLWMVLYALKVICTYISWSPNAAFCNGQDPLVALENLSL